MHLCGIAGFVGTKNYHTHEASALLKLMSDSLIHRGPDGSGHWYESGVGLAHRRLSIIDIDGGAQPMIGTNAPSTRHLGLIPLARCKSLAPSAIHFASNGSI